jgi:hypothetical protein
MITNIPLTKLCWPSKKKKKISPNQNKNKSSVQHVFHMHCDKLSSPSDHMKPSYNPPIAHRP